MSTGETLPDPNGDRALVAAAEAYTRAHPRAAREERHLGMLREMQDDNMCIQTLLRASAQAEARRQAVAEHQQDDEAPPARLEAIGRAHANMVRATRLLMMTEIQIDEGRIARLEGHVQAVKAEQDKQASYERICDKAVDEQVAEVRDVIEAMIECEVGDDADRSDALLKGLYQALEAMSGEDGFSEAPVGQLAERICAGLGFTPNWDDWEDEDWARSEAQLEIEGSPYCPMPRVVQDQDGRYRFSARKRTTGPP